VGVTKKIPKLN